MNDISVICRAYDAEAPYIKSFIDHYTNIGCKEFHVVIPLGNPYRLLFDQISDYDHVKIYTNHEIRNFDEAQNAALTNIKTSHFIFIDIDEFLDVADINSLLLEDYIRLNWAIAPYHVSHFDNAKYHNKRIKGFFDRQFKVIARTKICQRIDIHGCKFYSNVELTDPGLTLLHYVSRSYSDLFLRNTVGDYENTYLKTISSQLREGITDCFKIPIKYKLTAIYQRLAMASQEKFKNYCWIDQDIENELIRINPFYSSFDGLHESLLHYFSRIDLRRFLNAIRRNKTYQKYGRLPHFLLSEICDQTLMEEFHGQDWIRLKPRNRFNIFRQ